MGLVSTMKRVEGPSALECRLLLGRGEEEEPRYQMGEGFRTEVTQRRIKKGAEAMMKR